MLLSGIAADLGMTITGGDAEITSVEYDSRKVRDGSLFCCMQGLISDGHNFAAQAVEKGAAALLVERLLPLDVPQIVVPDGRVAMAHAAAAFYGHPEREMLMLGVTGTNGKTSTTYMVKSIAEAAGMKVGLIGTIRNMIGDTMLETGRTTPESADLFALLRFRATRSCRTALRASSSASDCSRISRRTIWTTTRRSITTSKRKSCCSGRATWRSSTSTTPMRNA